MYVLILGLILLLCIVILSFLLPLKRKSLKNKHVVITGGSSGIGKQLGILAAKEGAHVTILARNVERLRIATEEIASHVVDNSQQVNNISLHRYHFLKSFRGI